MNKRDAYLWLKNISGITSKTIEKIEKSVDNIDDLMDFSDKEIYNLENLNLNIKENIVKCKSHSYLDNIKEQLYLKSVKYICIEDDNYPEKLKYIYNAPKLLYYKGDIAIANKDLNIAVVGSRKCTQYGKNCAKDISSKLANLGITIVSGLALGIDSYSHVGCIEGNGKTIAVLGSSVDNPLPKQNIGISEKILENGGVLISEYNVNSRVFPSNFCQRNRIISGISDGVIVVEAANKSGALITVDYALEQGRNVFAIPGNITSEMSKGCHKIIKEGASLIENIDDILNEYNLISINSYKNGKNYDNINLNAEETIIINAIKKEGNLHIDKICDYTEIEIRKVNSILNKLKLSDLLVEMNNNIYSLNV